MLAYFSVSLVAEILIQSSGNSGCFRSRDVIPDPNTPATIHSFTCSHNTGQADRDIFRGSKASLFDTDSSMVYCVVVGCSNRTNDRKDKPKFEGSFHQLPEDPHVRRLWIKRINRQDHEWLKFLAGDKTADGSTAKRHVCSQHFIESDFIVPNEIAVRMGFKPGRRSLMPDAVPSLHMGKSAAAETASVVPSKKPRLAAVKREHRRVSWNFDNRSISRHHDWLFRSFPYINIYIRPLNFCYAVAQFRLCRPSRRPRLDKYQLSWKTLLSWLTPWLQWKKKHPAIFRYSHVYASNVVISVSNILLVMRIGYKNLSRGASTPTREKNHTCVECNTKLVRPWD